MTYTNCYQTAGDHCGSGCTSGMNNLRRAVYDLVPQASEGGCFVCREVRGGGSLSLHAVGRADDAMFTGIKNPVGTHLANALWSVHEDIGIQLVIWAKHIISVPHASEGWRPYSGVNPHWDHVHYELCPAAAQTLDYVTARKSLIKGLGLVNVPNPPPFPLPPLPEPVQHPHRKYIVLLAA